MALHRISALDHLRQLHDTIYPDAPRRDLGKTAKLLEQCVVDLRRGVKTDGQIVSPTPRNYLNECSIYRPADVIQKILRLQEGQLLVLPKDYFPPLGEKQAWKRTPILTIRRWPSISEDDWNAGKTTYDHLKDKLPLVHLDEVLVGYDYKGKRHGEPYQVVRLIDIVAAYLKLKEQETLPLEERARVASMDTATPKVVNLPASKDETMYLQHLPLYHGSAITRDAAQNSFQLKFGHTCEKVGDAQNKKARDSTARYDLRIEGEPLIRSERTLDENLVCHHDIFAYEIIRAHLETQGEGWHLPILFPKPKPLTTQFLEKSATQVVIEAPDFKAGKGFRELYAVQLEILMWQYIAYWNHREGRISAPSSASSR